MKRIRENFIVSVTLNTGFLAGGLTGFLMPALGALLHNATTIGVCLNAMRPTLGEPQSFTEAVTRRAGSRILGTVLLHHVQAAIWAKFLIFDCRRPD